MTGNPRLFGFVVSCDPDGLFTGLLTLLRAEAIRAFTARRKFVFAAKERKRDAHAGMHATMMATFTSTMLYLHQRL